MAEEKLDLDLEKIDQAAMALMYLTLHDGCRVWKGVSWTILDRLHEHDWITDPKSKTKSVILTEEGEIAARKALKDLFAK
jgi:hypothetical protein